MTLLAPLLAPLPLGPRLTATPLSHRRSKALLPAGTLMTVCPAEATWKDSRKCGQQRAAS